LGRSAAQETTGTSRLKTQITSKLYLNRILIPLSLTCRQYGINDSAIFF
jgi:hypothetical protein